MDKGSPELYRVIVWFISQTVILLTVLVLKVDEMSEHRHHVGPLWANKETQAF